GGDAVVDRAARVPLVRSARRGVPDRAGQRPPRRGHRRRPEPGAAVSAAPHIALAPARPVNVVSLAEWREARRAPVEADAPPATPLRLLRLVVDGDEPPPFSLDVFLRRARAVM